MTQPPEKDWERKRNKQAVRQAAQRMKKLERERLKELLHRLDETGRNPDPEPLPRIN